MTISVALCTYNGAAWLPQQLQSIEEQTLRPNEMVICDDDSSDATVELLQQLPNNFSEDIRIYKNSAQLGPRKNFEKAIGLCTGDIIFLCDQDDVWMPDKVAEMADYLQAHPEAHGVFCNGRLMDEAGNELGETMWDALYFEQPLRATTTPENLLYYLLLNGNIATGTALCFRKECVEKIMPLPEIQGLWHDHWIALVLAAQKSLHFIDTPLLSYRIHGAQQVGFPGRAQSAPGFRKAVHQTWLEPLEADTTGNQTTHLAWALQTFEKLQAAIAPRLFEATHLMHTGKQIAANMQIAKTAWLRTLNFWPRKIKLVKHWLKGGEYLRISWKDCWRI